jgi:hypothetical protein
VLRCPPQKKVAFKCSPLCNRRLFFRAIKSELQALRKFNGVEGLRMGGPKQWSSSWSSKFPTPDEVPHRRLIALPQSRFCAFPASRLACGAGTRDLESVCCRDDGFPTGADSHFIQKRVSCNNLICIPMLQTSQLQYRKSRPQRALLSLLLLRSVPHDLNAQT